MRGDSNMMDNTSMLYWYPKIKKLTIPQPWTGVVKCKTNITETLSNTNADFLSEKAIGENIDIAAVEKLCERLGYPVFMRSDYTSHKHNWKKSCFVTKKKDIIPHLQDIAHFSVCADIFTGIPFTAVMIRQYIKMASLFTAFHGAMPVNPEWRFFIHDGKIVCSHWYWIEDAIRNPSKENWKALMNTARSLTMVDGGFTTLTGYAKMVAKVLKGSWSIDFCLGANDVWYLIDMAESFKSWHPEDCPNHKIIKR
ncbi:MAG: hypothetical protein A2W25_04375 [candidate division Zixibacteria bacterium RBG_16_53_22]|nr:MAG: hypothetical protein A2W25_04375 [candidate division Zixibacteria bacterium RBG_16_53_22]